MKSFLIKKTGFTLAEVLITLMIISILASLTIPALINRRQKRELKESLKVGYSILYTAIQNMKVNDGDKIKDRYSACSSFKPVFIKYFNLLKDCGNSDCVASETSSSVYKTYSKQMASTTILDEGQFELNNGMTVLIQNCNPTCGLLISLDVNGYQKGPNIWGQDLFTFELFDDDTLKPAGSKGTGALGCFSDGFYERQNYYCSATSNSAYGGVACTAKALIDETYWNNLP